MVQRAEPSYLIPHNVIASNFAPAYLISRDTTIDQILNVAGVNFHAQNTKRTTVDRAWNMVYIGGNYGVWAWLVIKRTRTTKHVSQHSLVSQGFHQPLVLGGG